MDPYIKITKKFTKKVGSKVINRQYFRRKTGLKPGLLFATTSMVPYTYLFTLGIALEFPTFVTLYLMYATVLGPYYSTWLVQCQIKEPSIFVVFWQ